MGTRTVLVNTSPDRAFTYRARSAAAGAALATIAKQQGQRYVELTRCAFLVTATVVTCGVGGCTDDAGPIEEGDAGSGSEPDAGGSLDAGSTAMDSGTVSDPPPVDECTIGDPNWIFCDSFESGGTWDGSHPVPTLINEPGPFSIAGNRAAQLRVPPGRGGNGLYKEISPQLDAGYLRYYVKWEPGHDFSAPRHGPGGFHGGNTDCVGCSDNRPSDWFTSSLETVTRSPYTMQAYTYYPGMYMDCADPNGRCWGDMFPCTAGSGYCTNPEHAPRGDEPAFEAGRWYCVEQNIDTGTPTTSSGGANGILDFWVDGQQIGPWPGLWFRSSPDTRLSAIWLYLFHHEEHSVEGLLIDNVIVSRERIGCPSGG